MYIERFSGTNIGFLGRFCTRKGTNQTVRLFDFNTKITVFTMKYDQDSFDWRQSYDFFLTLSIIIKQLKLVFYNIFLYLSYANPYFLCDTKCDYYAKISFECAGSTTIAVLVPYGIQRKITIKRRWGNPEEASHFCTCICKPG